MIGGVFGKITEGVSNLIGGFVENVKDVAADVRPGTLASVIAPEASTAVLAATTIQNVLQRSSEGRSEERSLTQPRESTMPHVDGHMDGELPVGGVGLENANAAFIGLGTQALTQLGRQFLRGLPGGAGSAATGVAGGAVTSLLMDRQMDKCAPKPFVRFTDCGDPIITRKMKKQAIEAVNCSGAEAAARALTNGDLELLTMITSKQFPPRRMGISGAQMATTERTQRKLMRFHKRMQEACKAPPVRRR